MADTIASCRNTRQSEESLINLPYKQLQKIASIAGLPANLKQAQMIAIIQAHRCDDDATVERILMETRETRKGRYTPRQLKLPLQHSASTSPESPVTPNALECPKTSAVQSEDAPHQVSCTVTVTSCSSDLICSEVMPLDQTEDNSEDGTVQPTKMDIQQLSQEQREQAEYTPPHHEICQNVWPCEPQVVTALQHLPETSSSPIYLDTLPMEENLPLQNAEIDPLMDIKVDVKNDLSSQEDLEKNFVELKPVPPSELEGNLSESLIEASLDFTEGLMTVSSQQHLSLYQTSPYFSHADMFHSEIDNPTVLPKSLLSISTSASVEQSSSINEKASCSKAIVPSPPKSAVDTVVNPPVSSKCDGQSICNNKKRSSEDTEYPLPKILKSVTEGSSPKGEQKIPAASPTVDPVPIITPVHVQISDRSNNRSDGSTSTLDSEMSSEETSCDSSSSSSSTSSSSPLDECTEEDLTKSANPQSVSVDGIKIKNTQSKPLKICQTTSWPASCRAESSPIVLLTQQAVPNTNTSAMIGSSSSSLTVVPIPSPAVMQRDTTLKVPSAPPKMAKASVNKKLTTSKQSTVTKKAAAAPKMPQHNVVIFPELFHPKPKPMVKPRISAMKKVDSTRNPGGFHCPATIVRERQSSPHLTPGRSRTNSALPSRSEQLQHAASNSNNAYPRGMDTVKQPHAHAIHGLPRYSSLPAANTSKQSAATGRKNAYVTSVANKVRSPLASASNPLPLPSFNQIHNKIPETAKPSRQSQFTEPVHTPSQTLPAINTGIPNMEIMPDQSLLSPAVTFSSAFPVTPSIDTELGSNSYQSATVVPKPVNQSDHYFAPPPQSVPAAAYMDQNVPLNHLPWRESSQLTWNPKTEIHRPSNPNILHDAQGWNQLHRPQVVTSDHFREIRGAAQTTPFYPTQPTQQMQTFPQLPSTQPRISINDVQGSKTKSGLLDYRLSGSLPKSLEFLLNHKLDSLSSASSTFTSQYVVTSRPGLKEDYLFVASGSGPGTNCVDFYGKPIISTKIKPTSHRNAATALYLSQENHPYSLSHLFDQPMGIGRATYSSNHMYDQSLGFNRPPFSSNFLFDQPMGINGVPPNIPLPPAPAPSPWVQPEPWQSIPPAWPTHPLPTPATPMPPILPRVSHPFRQNLPNAPIFPPKPHYFPTYNPYYNHPQYNTLASNQLQPQVQQPSALQLQPRLAALQPETPSYAYSNFNSSFDKIVPMQEPLPMQLASQGQGYMQDSTSQHLTGSDQIVNQCQSQLPVEEPDLRGRGDQLSLSMIYSYLASTEQQLTGASKETAHISPTENNSSQLPQRPSNVHHGHGHAHSGHSNQPPMTGGTTPQYNLNPTTPALSTDGARLKTPSYSMKAPGPAKPAKTTEITTLTREAASASVSAVRKSSFKERLRCAYHDKGCSVLLPPSQLTHHEPVCEYKTSDCPKETCEWVGRARKLATHIREAHRPEINTGSDSKHILDLKNIQAHQHVCFLQEVSRKLFAICVHRQGNMLYVSIQFVASGRSERPTIACGSIEVVGKDGQPHSWRGKLLSYQQTVDVLRGTKSCLELEPQALIAFGDSCITIHISIRVYSGNTNVNVSSAYLAH